MSKLDKKSQEVVDNLIETAVKDKKITFKKIMDTISDIDLSTEQIDTIYQKMEKKKVTIIDESSDDTAKSKAKKETKPKKKKKKAASSKSTDLGKSINVDDPVRMYLKEIGKVSLLSAQEEIELAKRIEDGDEIAK